MARNSHSTGRDQATSLDTPALLARRRRKKE
jgi:hypothetical protein